MFSGGGALSIIGLAISFNFVVNETNVAVPVPVESCLAYTGWKSVIRTLVVSPFGCCTNPFFMSFVHRYLAIVPLLASFSFVGRTGIYPHFPNGTNFDSVGV